MFFSIHIFLVAAFVIVGRTFGGHTFLGHTYILGGYLFLFSELCAFIECSCSNAMGNFELISIVYEHVGLVLNFMLEFPYCLSNTNLCC